MKFRVAREVLADAVAWTARSLPPRPSVPVLAGILLEVDGNQLSVSGFDYEVSARAEVDVQATESGRVLVPGRLLAEITRALPPHPVDITAEGPRLAITCGNARFSLPTLPVEDYPSLPSMPSSAGLVDSDVFAEAVGQVAVAAGRDDTLPDAHRRPAGDRGRPDHPGRHRPLPAGRARVRLAAGDPGGVRRRPRAGADARRRGEDADQRPGDRAVAVVGQLRRGHPRPVGQGPADDDPAARRRVREVPRDHAERVELARDAAGRACSPTPPSASPWSPSAARPLRCEFTPGQVTLRAGGTDDEGQAEERCDVEFDGEPLTIGFNPTFLLDGLAAVHTERARMDFTSPLKPAVLSGVDEPAADDGRPRRPSDRAATAT